ncbi:AAA family ATPase [Qipengyuania flava]|uniref:AAA family ATPase n=1 Tax=Qipengyuania flava TaxID=192812 RepID=UPI0027E22D45|nr:AAA family ATPase [Qipengyuania flava]
MPSCCPAKAIDALSQRTAAIDARLAERGTSRAEASAAEKQIAALDTREAKTSADHRNLRADWRATADANGFDKAARDRLVGEARERARSSEATARPELLARQAVAWAAAKLSEREAVFAASALAREAGDFAFGKTGHGEISAAIAEAGERGELVPRTFLDRRGAEFAGFTTPQAIKTERTMLRLAEAGRGMAHSLASPVAATRTIERAARQSARSGYAWTDDQKRATADLLTSGDRITAVQGYAGTAKTTTVLATYAREARRLGLAVTALAPTASAATVLGEALGLRGDTVARHLLAPEAKSEGKDCAWIVDEASMLSAYEMAKLLARADKAGARLVLVGDVKQLGSVGAGAAFAQLQQAGMATAKLAEVVRQTNAGTREAVMASIEGHAGKALAALERGGGQVIEGTSPVARLGAMARHYLALSPSERARTLVIEPSREGRDRLTSMIRAELTEGGELSRQAVQFDALEAKGLTRAGAREAASYAIGDVVRFSRDYTAKGVRRGENFAITAIDPERGRIALESRDGQSIDWQPRQWGAGKAEVFEPRPMELRTGDRVQFTRNDREAGRVNGLGGAVTRIDPDLGRATVKLANGREQKLDLSDPRDVHLRHAYVQTAHAAQGQTSERVLIHADSRSTNLVDQKMLYVALSRAKAEAVVVTDDKDRLVRAIYERAGEKQTAMTVSTLEIGKSKAMGAGLG